MIKYFLFFLIINLISNNEQYDDNILILNEDKFDQALKKYDNLLIFFYTPHNKERQKLLKIFNTAANVLKKEGKTLAKVNCAKNKRIKFQYNIHKYPTLFLFNKWNNKYIKYEGENKESDIIDFVRKKSVSIKSDL